MSCGGDCKDGRKEGEEFKRPGPNKVADDFVQLGRHSFGRNGTVPAPSLDIDEKLLIDPRLLYIGSKIGEGAHGKVYEGKYKEQIVAIKVLNSGNTPEEKATFEARFIREVNMMSRVKHENLVKFIGACKDPIMVIASELLPGMSLKKYLLSIRPKQLDLHQAVSFALDIARAMDCLHANGIIHRDLKPDNLLLTANQKNVKLVDFGLAREETVTEMMTAETGTYRWMAPELYSTVTLRRGEKKHYTNKVDVYSFGIVLWELLTNRMPFEGMSNLQAAYAAAFKQMRPPLPADAPPELVFIVQSCWVEDPNTRPSFSQIIRMLNAFLFTIPPPSMPEPEVVPSVVNNRGTITATSSARTGGKLSFLRQLFAAKRTGNSRT
ncbi:serine/threonine-protein kinase STY13 isoform X2 [Elaeis guineensis]|uniref:Serine/threonine-protein kinase STY13 n=2 Tax=Elaeis guineensis var. tenera TaxID=51953 RepID=A0A6I9RAS3_ELAGV|nr:serine/threonine-protein kinase STY13 [Elaeis guineensis]